MAHTVLTPLDDGGLRWRHTVAVAARAAEAARIVPLQQIPTLLAAAWLHDIGYSPSLDRHGFHPVDGAVHICDHLGWPTVAGLVAHHSGARFIAGGRGLSPLMAPFASHRSWTGPLADALTWADQTTGPDGRTVTLEERLREMLLRHGPDSPNARCNGVRAPALVVAVNATEARLAHRGG